MESTSQPLTMGVDGSARHCRGRKWRASRRGCARLIAVPLPAGFSISGNYIISCDDVRLLLWSKDGQQIAELYSARSDTNGAVKMQSPVVVEEQGKIYGADGYDFLVWDLESLHKRLSRKPDNVPRVKGEIVFRDRVRQNTEPEVMNIRVDAKGEHIITATRS